MTEDVVQTPPSRHGLCNVQYAFGTSIGYRFRPNLILTASKEENLGDPTFVDGNVRSVRLLASRTGLGGRVSLLAVYEPTERFGTEDMGRYADPEKPVDFSSATALGKEGMGTGYFLSFATAERSIDFVASDGLGLPVGTPVFYGDQFVGLAARKRVPLEQWLFTFIRLLDLLFNAERRKAIEERTQKLLGDQLLSLARSLRSDITRLWSLYELVEDSRFKPYLERSDPDMLQPPGEGDGPGQQESVSGIFRASTAGSSKGIGRYTEAAVMECTPPGIWVALERTPRRFPLAPRASAALIIFVLLATTLVWIGGVPLIH